MLQQNQRYIIVSMFSSINDALPLCDILDILKKEHGYNTSGSIIRDAIQEGLIYVDNIENNGEVYLALTDYGERTWSELKSSE